MANEQDLALVRDALAGDTDACAQIGSDEMCGWIQGVLVKRGATPTEARDLTADVFGDCFGRGGNKSPLLQAYNGGGPLRAFLSRAALNRLIDLKRRQRFRGNLPSRGFDDAPTDEFDLLEGDSDLAADDNLVNLLRDALIHAFGQCNARDLMLMRLVSIHGVRQESIAHSLGWSQSKVSRAIAGVMEEIRAKTMEELNKADPWLDLDWADFLGLCRNSTGFLVGISDQKP
ncbi:MAG: RNA polymerase sigma factor [Roseibacillus sp.]